MRRARVAGAVMATLAALAAPAAAHALDTDPFGDVAAPALLAAAAAAPAGFEETVAFTGLQDPTVVRFAPDGRVFVAEKGGRIKVFDGLGDATPTVFADLSTQVHDFWDRGLLGMELDPGFATNGRVFVLYARNEEPFSTTMPRWPDGCPTPPGATGDGCVVTGTLSRLDAAGRRDGGLIEKDFCQQYPSHSTGSLAFGADGTLYVSAGDGASFNFTDYGPGRQPAEPVRRSARRRRRARCRRRRPRAARCARRTSARRRPRRPRRLDPAPRSRHRERRCRATRSPATRTRTPAASSPTACATRSASPCGPGRTSSGSATWAGATGRRSTGSRTRPRRVRNFGWPCYEGTFRAAGLRLREAQLCEDLYAEGAERAHPAALHLRALREGRARRVLPDRQLGDRRPGLLHERGRSRTPTTARCSSPTTRATASG